MISLHIFLVSILQGLTEFLPISSSAHLIILPTIMAVKDQGILIDISVHLGSLLALLVFFRKDSLNLVKGAYYLAKFNLKDRKAQLVLQLIVLHLLEHRLVTLLLQYCQMQSYLVQVQLLYLMVI